MRWAMDRLPNIKGVIDRYHLLDRILARNLEKMRGAGSPCVSWRNVGLKPDGTLSTDETKCYCWTTADGQVGSPDKKHFLCMGTGFLRGYQKYGYDEIVVSTPSTLTHSANVIIGGTRGSAISISGTSTSENVLTERFLLEDFKSVDYFLVNDSSDISTNRIEYAYSTDDSTWIPLTMVDFTLSPAANRSASFSLTAGTEYIRFRITLKKRTAASPSAKFNSLRFRYRKFKKLNEIDPTFDVDIPAFLAAREQQSREIAQGRDGWTTRFPLRWWVMPDAVIENEDIIMFLGGEFSEYKFVAKNVTKYTYGENLQILHRGFESTYIRDSEDLLGIVHYLL